ncbi:MAG: hypothetical protein ACJAT2_003415 [Bacteriovoracaceae bacterium]
MASDPSESAKKNYRDRLKYLRKGQESYHGKEISKAVQYYATYLKSLAEYFEVTETQLDPKFFDPRQDKAELLLISQVYWDLAKAYDRSPGLQSECIRCLGQFVRFTIGFKHQHINAQLLKKYLRQNKTVNQSAFKSAQSKILVESKKCYIASFAYGEDSLITNDLRIFKKDILIKSRLGLSLIDQYYQYSPKLIDFCRKHEITGTFLTIFFFKPFINTLHFLVKRGVRIAKKTNS